MAIKWRHLVALMAMKMAITEMAAIFKKKSFQKFPKNYENSVISTICMLKVLKGAIFTK